MIVLKIVMWILLSVLGLLVVILLSPVSVALKASPDGDFSYSVSLLGIPIPLKLFLNRKKSDVTEKRRKKKKKVKVKGTEKGKGDKKDGAVAEEKPKKSFGETISLITGLLSEAARSLPKAFRIRLKRLYVVVGGKEAADIAVNYGRIYAVIEGTLALFNEYRGLLYGFFAKREKISISTDFLSTKTTVDAYITISFFLWQLLWAAVRVGVKYIVLTLEEKEEQPTDLTVKSRATNQ